MAANTYPWGSKPRFSAEFRLISTQALVDPTDVWFLIKAPNLPTVTKKYSLVEVTKLATGQYYIDYDLQYSGTWWYRFEGTGVVVAAAEREIVVNPSVFHAP